jgi:pyrimidine-nucleoside phosphorylase
MRQNEMRQLIARKRDGHALRSLEWQAIVSEFTNGKIPEAEMSAFLMACVLRDIDADETQALTQAMVDSGATLKYKRHPVVDKHSSGGVGDTVSLLAVPIAAAAGATVAKLAGHALGHTGGTLDKLEALPGVRVNLGIAEFTSIVERVGGAIAAQTDMIAPADRVLYALRDRTATVPSTGLITASIVSKKIAAGADAIVYDIKSGGGAFMQRLDDARELAKRITTITKAMGRTCIAYITDMDTPLGAMIGSGLEAYEALGLLEGRIARKGRLYELALEIADAMLSCCNLPKRAREVVESGAAYEKMIEILSAQGGNCVAIAALKPHSKCVELRSKREGYVTTIDAVTLGEAARDLTVADGAFAGLEMLVEPGQKVHEGDPLVRLYGTHDGTERIVDAFGMGEAAEATKPLIYEKLI